MRVFFHQRKGIMHSESETIKKVGGKIGQRYSLEVLNSGLTHIIVSTKVAFLTAKSLVKFHYQYELHKKKLCKDSFLTDIRDYIPRISLFFKISK